jgi:hypothetical protein
MSDIVNISDLRKAFLEKTQVKDLKEFATSQQELLEKLLKENEHLKEKLEYTEKILKDFSTGVLTLPMTKEESICREQLELIKRRSAERALSLEDIKIFDILVKNLKIIQESYKEKSKDTFRDVEEIDLVAIATRPGTT